ncbi:hypothetical protein [Azohydromonas australica]|uniref:hypothetical protein n=1 Tax=Azohydromonas australica TaxID=364039 RepID=UPI0012EBAA70|nr:hypothetical protein [Azohydromonas australica]
MSTEPVIHLKQCRVMIVGTEQPAAPALALAKAKVPQPLLKLKARPSTLAAALPPAEPAAAAGAPPDSPRQERLSPTERERCQAAQATPLPTL